MILYSRIICLRGRWGTRTPFVTQALLTRLVIVTGAIINPIILHKNQRRSSSSRA